MPHDHTRWPSPDRDHDQPTHAPTSASPRSWRAGGGPTTRDLGMRPGRDDASQAVQLKPAPGGAPVADREAHARACQEDLWSLMAGQPTAAPVQGKGELQASTDAAIHAHAAAGVAGPRAELPHGEAIQRAFGHHDVSGIRAHVGGAAAEAATAIGAQAYATGSAVAFRSSPDLHTAAHEAAHVVQQRAGVHLKAGVGQVGDAYEAHADQVADRVVAGRSAVDLLDAFTSSGSRGAVVQCLAAEPTPTATGSEKAAANMLHQSRGSMALTYAREELRSAELAAREVQRAVERGAVTPSAAYQQVAEILLGMVRPLGVFYQASERRTAARATETPWQTPSEEAHALDVDGPEAAVMVNNTMRIALLLEQRHDVTATVTGGHLTAALRAGDDAAFGHLAAARAAVASVVAPLGWRLPATVAEANEVRFAHEACPIDGKQERGSAHCTLDYPERIGTEAALRDAVGDAVKVFATVCGRHAADLDHLIAKRKAYTNKVIDLFGKGIVKAFEAAAPGAGKAIGLVVDKAVGKYLDVMKARAAADDPVRKTRSMLDGLQAALTASLDDLRHHVDRLDDHQLERAMSEVRKLDDVYFESRLAPLIAAYRADLEMEGRPLAFADALGDGNLNRAHYRIVKIKTAAGLRAAQVADVTIEKHDLMNVPVGTSHKYTFLRWAHAESMPFLDDAPTVEARAVRNAPLGDVLAQPNASDDGTDAAVGE